MTTRPPGDSTEWIERMRRADLLDAASSLGFAPELLRDPRKRGLPCPVCGAERRHTKTRDKRGAVGLRPDGKGWRCFQCDASGDVLDFVAAQRHGKRWRELGTSAKTEVREWCIRWLGMSTTSVSYTLPCPRPVLSPAVRPEAPTCYPPVGEVTALWNSCVRVDDVHEVAEWLAAEGIAPQIVADRDLARALRPGTRMPSWAHRKVADNVYKSWPEDGYLLLAQQVDVTGSARSVLARNVRGMKPKSRAPGEGYERRGLVLACGLSRQVLATGAPPDWWPTDQPLRFEVCEGEKKWLGRITTNGIALHGEAAETLPAVLGIESGSWTDDLVDRLPRGSTVYIATDVDVAGAQYATKILRSLEARLSSGSIRVELRREHEIYVKDGRRAVRVKAA